MTMLLLLTVAIPAYSQLSQDDLNQIRLIIKEEIDPVKKDVAVIQGKLEGIDKRFDGVNKQIDIVTYIVCALIALIAIAIIPQYIFLFRSNKTAEQDRKIAALTEEIEILKKQRIVS